MKLKTYLGLLLVSLIFFNVNYVFAINCEELNVVVEKISFPLCQREVKDILSEARIPLEDQETITNCLVKTMKTYAFTNFKWPYGGCKYVGETTYFYYTKNNEYCYEAIKRPHFFDSLQFKQVMCRY